MMVAYVKIVSKSKICVPKSYRCLFLENVDFKNTYLTWYIRLCDLDNEIQ